MNIDKIIKQVARAHNTTPEEVYSEMQIALDAAFQSKDPEVQNWFAVLALGAVVKKKESRIC